MGKKRYNQKDGVGKSKYVISYHDGKKKHKDGSDFFDIQIFRNKKDLAKFVNTLHKGGYVYGFNESVNEAKYKVGDTITVIRKDGMKYKGKVEKLNPLKLRTDSTSTVVLPNPMIKKVVKESVNEGKKRYYQQDRVGSAKYTISYHDGKKKHKDGSDFFDIQTFKNKKDLAKFVNTLHKGGFVYGFNESINESKTKESKVIQKVYQYSKTEKKFYDELAKHEVRIGQRDYAKFIINALRGFGINPREFKRIPDAEEKLYQTVSKKWLNSKNYLTKS